MNSCGLSVWNTTFSLNVTLAVEWSTASTFVIFTYVSDEYCIELVWLPKFDCNVLPARSVIELQERITYAILGRILLLNNSEGFFTLNKSLNFTTIESIMTP